MECSVLTKFVFELIGTMVMILMGDGVCACVTLNKSKGQNSGWVVITLAWGLAVMCGVLIAGPYTGAHLNPAVTLGLAIAGLFPWNLVAPYVVAQMLGGALGAVMVWAVYKDHYDATPDGDAKLGTFCTIPAIRNYRRNCFVEMVATLVLVGIIIGFSTAGNKAGLAALGPIPVTLLIVALGMSLGGPTGYAMNPARDLSPRIVHALLPLKNKRDSDWAYAWVPVVGPLLGAAIAGALGLIWLAI
jgi:MIP family channel protein